MFKTICNSANAKTWHICCKLSNWFPFAHSLLYLSHSLFRERFSTNSGVYKRLGEFNYGQPNYTTDRITTCIKDNWYIYIGEVKEEGIDDNPHGIGIKVWTDGGTQQLSNKV